MTWLRRAARLLPIFPLCVFAASCGFFVSNSSIVTVTITPTAVLLKAGNSPADSYGTLTFSSVTAGGTTSTNAANATWASSDPSVVSVTAGALTAGANTSTNPTATVTAKDGGVTSNACTVLLYTGLAPTTVAVGSTTGVTSFAIGTQFQAIATATFSGDTGLSSSGALTRYVTWSSNDTALATVNSSGVVTVLSASPFTITATATFGTAATAATVTGSQQFNNTTII